MNPVIDFMCSDAGQLLTVAVLFTALALNLLAFALRLFELFRRPDDRDGTDGFPRCGRSDDAEDDRKELES